MNQIEMVTLDQLVAEKYPYRRMKLLLVSHPARNARILARNFFA